MNAPRNLQTTAETDAADAVKRYAALPWRISGEGRLEILLLGCRYRRHWTVPSAACCGARTPQRSAERAAFHDAGVIGRLGSKPVGSYRCPNVQEDRSVELWHMTVFGIHVWGTLVNWRQEAKLRRQWWPVNEACEIVSEPGLAELLVAATPGSLQPDMVIQDGSAASEVSPRKAGVAGLASAAGMARVGPW